MIKIKKKTIKIMIKMLKSGWLEKINSILQQYSNIVLVAQSFISPCLWQCFLLECLTHIEQENLINNTVMSFECLIKTLNIQRLILYSVCIKPSCWHGFVNNWWQLICSASLFQHIENYTILIIVHLVNLSKDLKLYQWCFIGL